MQNKPRVAITGSTLLEEVEFRGERQTFVLKRGRRLKVSPGTRLEASISPCSAGIGAAECSFGCGSPKLPHGTTATSFPPTAMLLI